MKSIHTHLREEMYHGTVGGAGVFDATYIEVVKNDYYRIQEAAKRGVDLATIVDIGANIGYFSLLARSLYPWTRIIAIECFPFSLSLLKKNSQCLNIEIIEKPYGDGGKVDLVPHYINTCCATTPGSGVNTIRLAELNIDRSKPYMIKSDCEGAESAFFSGPDFEIAQGAAFFAMEGHYFPNKQGVFNSIPIYEFMNKLAFTHQTIFWQDRPGYLIDFIAIRKDVRLAWLL